MKKSLILIIVLVICSIIASVVPVSASMHTFVIQNMIDGAAPDSKITIPQGTYIENVVINKPLTLQGSVGTVVQPNSGAAFTITASGVHITGISIRGATFAIYLSGCNNAVITNCDLSNNGYGVYGDFASNNKIFGNSATGEKGNGIALGDGIFLNGGSYNEITGNVLSNNIAFGISLYQSTNNIIASNTIHGNTGVGIRLGPGSNNNRVNNNDISGNGDGSQVATFPACGILIVSATGNHIFDNTITNQQVPIIGSYIPTSIDTVPTAVPTPSIVPSMTPPPAATVVPTIKVNETTLIEETPPDSPPGLGSWALFLAAGIIIIAAFLIGLLLIPKIDLIG